MKQHEAVVLAMQQNGGYATLGQLYQLVPKIPDCVWRTKTVPESIRRIVQTRPEFFKIRPGLWALTAEKARVVPLFTEKPAAEEKVYSHYFYQGLVVEIGNLKHYQTFVPAADKNKTYSPHQKLGDIATLPQIHEFTYAPVVKEAANADVVWFNERKYPKAFFEIEHTTTFYNAFRRFLELQDFRVDFYVVAEGEKKQEFERKIASHTYAAIRASIKFSNYEEIADLHAKLSASVQAEKAVL